MTEKEIAENAVLICNFCEPGSVDDIDIELEKINQHLPKFHKWYEYLMPVLQGIQNYGCIIEINYALVVTCRICYLGKNKNDKAINFYGDNNGGEEPIMAIYKCVVEFLKYLENENKI